VRIKFVIGVLLSVVVYGAFHLHPQPIPPSLDWRDTVWTAFIAFTFALAALVMLLPRRPWSWRAVGLFLTSVGTALIYGGVFVFTHLRGEALPEWYADAIRSVNVVGGPMLAYGLCRWLKDNWRTFPAMDEMLFEREWFGPEAMTDNLRRSVRCAVQVLLGGSVHQLFEGYRIYNATGWMEVLVVACYAAASNMVWNTVEDRLGVRFLGPMDHRLGDALIEGRQHATTLTDCDFPTWPSNARPADEDGA
jgi:hypothetical protein